MSLWINFVAVWRGGEYWRLITNFFFFGHFNISFIFHLYFLVRHSKMLEETTYARRPADYLYLWIFGAFVILLIAYVLSHFRLTRVSPFLASSLTSVVVYVWAKCNPHLRMSFLYLFTFSAPWLPWVILSLVWVLGQDPMDDLLGIVVGKIYHSKRGKKLIIMILLFL